MQKVKNCDLRNESIRAALAAIAASNGGYLDPQHVVYAARDPSSILHNEFEWDDEEAGENYRIAQASALIRRVKFTIVRQNAESKQITLSTTRSYQSRVSARYGEQKGYEPVQAIMADPQKRNELINQVLKELNAYRRRYSDLVALNDIWASIDDAMLMHETPATQGMAAQAEISVR